MRLAGSDYVERSEADGITTQPSISLSCYGICRYEASAPLQDDVGVDVMPPILPAMRGQAYQTSTHYPFLLSLVPAASDMPVLTGTP